MAHTMQGRFEALQGRWGKAHEKLLAVIFQVEQAYRKPYYVYAPKGQQDRVERARAAEDKAQDAVFAWLDAHSPRSWRSGVPASWVCESLTYSDALTTGTMSVVPPPCYGYTPADASRFAAALPERETVAAW